MLDAPKAVWSIPYISVAFFLSFKHNFIAYRSSSRPDCIFEIHQLWQSGFRRVYSNCCCSCSFEAEIIKIGQSSHKMYSNTTLNFQESTTILNACTKIVWKLIESTTHSYFFLIHQKLKKKIYDIYEPLNVSILKSATSVRVWQFDFWLYIFSDLHGHKRCVRSARVIVVANGHGDSSSNPERCRLHFI